LATLARIYRLLTVLPPNFWHMVAHCDVPDTIFSAADPALLIKHGCEQRKLNASATKAHSVPPVK
jgi:hypothetical protein